MRKKGEFKKRELKLNEEPNLETEDFNLKEEEPKKQELKVNIKGTQA